MQNSIFYVLFIVYFVCLVVYILQNVNLVYITKLIVLRISVCIAFVVVFINFATG